MSLIVEQSKYVGTNLKSQNFIYEGIKNRSAQIIFAIICAAETFVSPFSVEKNNYSRNYNFTCCFVWV
jgi:hypothetical protein